ncbi:orexin/Hypocretin receptor type 1-like, partial [Physella acuta]|uniref:orexin/Hypocretin receptor type 1-like n=1 Tax=Physella acuta TaxID=109671 RepID=UPI0027DAE0A4
RHILVGEKIKGYWCMEVWTPVLSKIYNLYMILVVFILPLGLMAYAYICICQRLWQVRYQHSTMRATQNYVRPERALLPLPSPQSGTENRTFLRTSISVYGKRISSGNEDSTRKQVVKMLVFVVILFALCWGPIMFNNVLVSFDILPELHQGFIKPMRQAFWLMAYSNSCLNPIVYGFMSKNFRESFRNTVRICVMRGSTRDMARHKALWRCSFQAHTSVQVNNRSPQACGRAITDPYRLCVGPRPSMSSQGSTQVTHVKKMDSHAIDAPDFD